MSQQNKTFIKAAICNLLLVAQLIFIGKAYSAGPVGKIDNVDFSFEGVFGTYDKNQLQRIWNRCYARFGRGKKKN